MGCTRSGADRKTNTRQVGGHAECVRRDCTGEIACKCESKPLEGEQLCTGEWLCTVPLNGCPNEKPGDFFCD